MKSEQKSKFATAWCAVCTVNQIDELVASLREIGYNTPLDEEIDDCFGTERQKNISRAVITNCMGSEGQPQVWNACDDVMILSWPYWEQHMQQKIFDAITPVAYCPSLAAYINRKIFSKMIRTMRYGFCEGELVLLKAPYNATPFSMNCGYEVVKFDKEKMNLIIAMDNVGHEHISTSVSIWRRATGKEIIEWGVAAAQVEEQKVEVEEKESTKALEAYQLMKDIPGINAGAIFIWQSQLSSYILKTVKVENARDITHLDSNLPGWRQSAESVMMNPGFFQPLKSAKKADDTIGYETSTGLKVKILPGREVHIYSDGAYFSFPISFLLELWNICETRKVYEKVLQINVGSDRVTGILIKPFMKELLSKFPNALAAHE